MTKTPQPDRRLEWSTPRLRQIEAGSAEAQPSGIKNDGGGGGSNKS